MDDKLKERFAAMDAEMEKRAKDLEEAIDALWLGSITEMVKEAAVNALYEHWEDHNWEEFIKEETV